MVAAVLSCLLIECTLSSPVHVCSLKHCRYALSLVLLLCQHRLVGCCLFIQHNKLSNYLATSKYYAINKQFLLMNAKTSPICL